MQVAGQKRTAFALTLSGHSYFLPRLHQQKWDPKRERSRDHICENTLRNTPAPVSLLQCMMHVALSKSMWMCQRETVKETCSVFKSLCKMPKVQCTHYISWIHPQVNDGAWKKAAFLCLLDQLTFLIIRLLRWMSIFLNSRQLYFMSKFYRWIVCTRLWCTHLWALFGVFISTYFCLFNFQLTWVT